MGREEIEQEKMNKICKAQDWPQVPFEAYVMIKAIIDGTVSVSKVRGVVQLVFRDYQRDDHGYLLSNEVHTFAKIRLDIPLPDAKRGRTIETLNMVHCSRVEPIGPLDLMIEGISI